ncbi:MAG: co-chaperone GroES [Planctomycetes bacterium]|nr:co-chaperone GroES [Planctomycetota bacterium]
MKPDLPANLVVVGDRVLIRPERGEERTKVGLYLPETSTNKNPVRGGRVVAVGPGTQVITPADVEVEPWKVPSQEPKFVPMQARLGDFALFLKNAAVEITYRKREYLVVPQSGILLLIRDEDGNASEVAAS